MIPDLHTGRLMFSEQRIFFSCMQYHISYSQTGIPYKARIGNNVNITPVFLFTNNYARKRTVGLSKESSFQIFLLVLVNYSCTILTKYYSHFFLNCFGQKQYSKILSRFHEFFYLGEIVEG